MIIPQLEQQDLRDSGWTELGIDWVSPRTGRSMPLEEALFCEALARNSDAYVAKCLEELKKP
jgi:hypothetical protein